MNKKEGFLLFTEQKVLFKKMSNEQAGILIKAIYEYEDTGQLPELEFGLDIAFTTIKTTLDKNRLKYEEVSKKRSAAAKSRNKNKQNEQNEQMQANDIFDNKSNCIDNEYESDTDSDDYHHNNEIKNNQDDSCVDDPIEFFKKNFNDNNDLSDYQENELETFVKNIGQKLVIYAMKKCVNYKVTNLQYLKSIINNWQKSNVTTIEEAEKIDQEFQLKKNISKSTPSKKEYEYQQSHYENLETLYCN